MFWTPGTLAALNKNIKTHVSDAHYKTIMFVTEVEPEVSSFFFITGNWNAFIHIYHWNSWLLIQKLLKYQKTNCRPHKVTII